MAVVERKDLLGFVGEQRDAVIDCIDEETKANMASDIAQALTSEGKFDSLNDLLRNGNVVAIDTLLGLVLNSDDGNQYSVAQDGDSDDGAKTIKELIDAIKAAIDDVEIVTAIADPAGEYIAKFERGNEDTDTALDELKTALTELTEEADDKVNCILAVLIEAIPEPINEEPAEAATT